MTYVLPRNWTKTRVLVSGIGSQFTVNLRQPVNHVAQASAVSIENCNGILCVDGLNTHELTTVDASGNVIHLLYLANNLGGELTYSLFSPPVLEEPPQLNVNIYQLKVSFLDVYGNPFTVPPGTVVSCELDLWSYNEKH